VSTPNIGGYWRSRRGQAIETVADALLRITSSAGNDREPTGPIGCGERGPNANQGRIAGTRQMVVAALAPRTEEGAPAWRAAEREAAAGADTRTRAG